MNSKNVVWISPLLLPKSPLDPRNNEYSTSVMVWERNQMMTDIGTFRSRRPVILLASILTEDE